jgi:hypothetical protein
MSLKNPVTRPGIDPRTVRLVAQRLNHYATPGPRLNRRLPKSPITDWQGESLTESSVSMTGWHTKSLNVTGWLVHWCEVSVSVSVFVSVSVCVVSYRKACCLEPSQIECITCWLVRCLNCWVRNWVTGCITVWPKGRVTDCLSHGLSG